VTRFRRRTPDPAVAEARAAFRRVTALLDSAQRSLLAAVPTSRDPGVPLAEAIAAFLDGLTAADEAMTGWRAEPTQALWERCRSSLLEARAKADKLGRTAGGSPLDFESLNARLGEVLSPLEEFAEVAAALR